MRFVPTGISSQSRHDDVFPNDAGLKNLSFTRSPTSNEVRLRTRFRGCWQWTTTICRRSCCMPSKDSHRLGRHVGCGARTTSSVGALHVMYVHICKTVLPERFISVVSRVETVQEVVSRIETVSRVVKVDLLESLEEYHRHETFNKSM